MCPSLIQIGSKTAEKNSAQTNRHDRHYENNGHLAVNQLPPPRRLCFRRCLSVCLLASLQKNFPADLHEIFRKGRQWANEQKIKFWCRSGSGIRIQIPIRIRIRRIRIRIRIATLVRRALAEVCTVPVFLVMITMISIIIIIAVHTRYIRKTKQIFNKNTINTLKLLNCYKILWVLTMESRHIW